MELAIRKIQWGHSVLGRMAVALVCALLGVCGSEPANRRGDRINLFPKFTAGQKLTYQTSYRSDKQTKTQSSLILPSSSDDIQVEVRGLVRLEILDIQAQHGRNLIHARSSFESLDSQNARATPPGSQAIPVQEVNPQQTPIDLTILPDGSIDQVKGLDSLPPDQQQAWREWASRFAVAATTPENGVKPAEKWKSEGAEKSPSPIAGLTWVRDSSYVRNEPCRTLQSNREGNFLESDDPPDTCAVILTIATLRQKSSPNDSTPPDFKLHQLRTVGTARGANKIITYVSLKTGLVVRATEEASQAMDVTVAKADGSNRVHYDIDARSHSQVTLVVDARATPK
jgi:hypothetical protein